VAVSFKKDVAAAEQLKQELEANGKTCILLQKDVSIPRPYPNLFILTRILQKGVLS
jgi:hypothetical protein